MKKILIPIEINDTTQQILDQTAKFFSDENSEVWLLHITEPNEYLFDFDASLVYPEYRIFEISPLFSRDEKAKMLKDEHVKFTEYVNYLNEKGVSTKGLFIGGSIEAAIEAKVEKLAIDIIVLGKHKRGKLLSLFENNTAQKILEKSSIPVVIIPIE